MRIIGGTLKSRKLQFPKTKLTRPMTDKTKETVFNIINGLLPNKHILDLYAGCGGLGLEALSRGAQSATFVDRADWATTVIEKNAQDLELRHKTEIVEMDVLKAIDKFKKAGRLFSIVFVDPPFQQGLVKKTLMKLDQSDIVVPFGQVIVGHIKQEEVPTDLRTLKVARTKKLGQACLTFLFRLDIDHGETKSYISGEL